MLDAGVVDQDVEAAELVFGEGDEVGDLLAPAHVGGVVADADAAGGLDAGAGALDFGRVAEAVEDHVAAARGHGAGQRQTDA